MSKRTTIYVSDKAEQILGSPDSVSGRINSILIRYDEICRSCRPALSKSEWCAVFDALNGCWMPAEHAQTDPARFLWAEIADTPGLGEKWGIDQDALVRKLRQLNYVERVAVVEYTTRFWQMADLPVDEAMEKLGITEAIESPASR